MKKTKTIDLTNLAELDIDEETDGFRPTWDNAILMTAYDERRTFVLTWDGRQLVLRQPLHDVLSRFARDNDVMEYERQAIYDLVGARKGRGYVAGHHRLVPTQGTTNNNVVYYMAHRLADDCACRNNQLVLASFRGHKRVFRVYLDTSLKTFERLLESANEVATYQLDALEWLLHNYGLKKVDKREGVRVFHIIHEHCRRIHNDIRRAWTIAVVCRILREYFSEEDYQEIIRRIKRNLGK